MDCGDGDSALGVVRQKSLARTTNYGILSVTYNAIYKEVIQRLKWIYIVFHVIYIPIVLSSSVYTYLRH